MMLREIRKPLAAIALLVFSSASWGLTITNPAPGAFGNDIDGNGQFIPGELLFNVELFDTLESVGLLGSEFGFYYAGDPGTRFTIFEAADQGPGQWATVNFNNGIIRDGDSGVIQSFSPAIIANGTNPIGFYLELTSALGIAAFGDDIIYTEANLNPIGEDQAAEFPSLGALDAFLIMFADINLNTGAQATLGAYLVAPLAAVPIPGALGLWLLGLGGIALFRRKIRAS